MHDEFRLCAEICYQYYSHSVDLMDTLYNLKEKECVDWPLGFFAVMMFENQTSVVDDSAEAYVAATVAEVVRSDQHSDNSFDLTPDSYSFGV